MIGLLLTVSFKIYNNNKLEKGLLNKINVRCTNSFFGIIACGCVFFSS